MNYLKKFQMPVKSLMVMHSGFGIRSVTSVLSKRVLIHGSEMNDISFGEMSKQVFSTISLLVSKNWYGICSVTSLIKSYIGSLVGHNNWWQPIWSWLSNFTWNFCTYNWTYNCFILFAHVFGYSNLWFFFRQANGQPFQDLLRENYF